MADSKKYVAFPRGRKPTREEALEIGRKLFDSIATEQAAKARAEAEKKRKPKGK